MVEIDFSETDQARELSFSTAELRALRRARHGLVVTEVADDSRGGVRVRVGPKTGYVGTVALPGGRRVVVRPKADIASLPELLALAYRTAAPPARAGTTAVESATPAEWLLVQLAGEIEHLLSRGLRRGYVERRERLPFVRGRTMPVLNPALLPLLDCEFTDFVSDTPENQLLRGVMELFSPAVRNRTVRRHYDDVLGRLADVTRIRPSLSDFDRVRLNRLNSHYKPSLDLARLALEGSGIVDAAGSVTAPAYFVLMWKVWENSAAAALRDAGIDDLIDHPRYSSAFLHVHGQPKLPVTIEPDLVVGRRQNPRLVIDLKWASVLTVDRYGKRRLRSTHLYQIATYATALDCDGILLYPLMGDEVDSEYTFEGRRIRVRTVDLSEPGLAGLRGAAEAIAAEVG